MVWSCKIWKEKREEEKRKYLLEQQYIKQELEPFMEEARAVMRGDKFMDVKKPVKKILLGIFLCLGIVFAVYEAVCIIVTCDVVYALEMVMNDEKEMTNMDSPFYRFSKNCFGDISVTKGKVRRVFTYCGKEKGCIHILYWQQFKDNNDNIILDERGTYAKLYIEKIDGEWVLTGSYIHP